jgi:uncharacterized membrane protein SpoIIM required for sporulation
MDLRIVLKCAANLAKIFFVCLAAGYLLGYAAIAYWEAPPEKVFNASVINSKITGPADKMAGKIVKDKGWVIFLHNSVLAFIFIAPVFLAGSRRFKNVFHSGLSVRPEGTPGGKFDLLLIKAMGLIAATTDKRLISLSFLLNIVNRLTTGILAFALGVTCASAEKLLSKFVILMAYLLPHGIIEMPAFIVAGALPLSLFAVLKSAVEKDCAADTFLIARNSAFSRTTVSLTASVFIALAVAGQIEDKITPMAGKYFSAQKKSAVETSIKK